MTATTNDRSVGFAVIGPGPQHVDVALVGEHECQCSGSEVVAGGSSGAQLLLVAALGRQL